MSKNTEQTYYQKNRDLILSKAKEYYEKNKKKEYKKIDVEICQKTKKLKKENMQEIGIKI